VNSLLQERDAEFKPKIEAIKGGLTGLSLDINFNVSGKKAKGLQCIQAWWGSGSTLGQGVGKTGYPGEVDPSRRREECSSPRGWRCIRRTATSTSGARRAPTACMPSTASSPSGPGRRARPR
jgi:hypothetical protein